MARLHSRGQGLCGASVPPNKEGWEECQSNANPKRTTIHLRASPLEVPERTTGISEFPSSIFLDFFDQFSGGFLGSSVASKLGRQ